ncbi:hypothetical protein BCR37DRAFT_382450 [Protomyces lactucae-debilis]|uniref:Uncharacterized protein n=1 Tax=Protomyces lactucae-debilis TaxID=2754530 RepID=A0A1Y2F2S8_PROLT|nr:uncharacterized protein BCR37DRAFT_382450 [Protomyces lactucae-debilis]ORY78181.1 hypothetical protein BCR37DRAFT_382450 [Protomyces lactucae-debilis]
MNMVSAWPKDLLSVRKLFRPSPLSFLEETYPLDKSTFTVLLPEDAELSKHWYMYTKYMILRYIMGEDGNERDRASHTYGLALEPCRPIGDVAVHGAETNKPFHLSASAIESPMVFFPSAVRQLHKTVQDYLASGISAEAINLGEVYERILNHTRDTLLCPPSFQAESTRQTALAKSLNVHDDAAVSDNLSAPPVDNVDLLTDESWWERMGPIDSHALSDWSHLALFDSDGLRQTMQEFWPSGSS